MIEELLQQVLSTKRQLVIELKNAKPRQRPALEEALADTKRQEKELRANL